MPATNVLVEGSMPFSAGQQQKQNEVLCVLREVAAKYLRKKKNLKNKPIFSSMLAEVSPQ